VCCSDYVVSSYSPTLSALLRAQSKAPLEAPPRISLLAIAEDCRKVPGMSTLRGVESELTHIEEIFSASKHDSTVEAIRSAATVEGVQPHHICELCSSCLSRHPGPGKRVGEWLLPQRRQTDRVEADGPGSRSSMAGVPLGLRNSQGRRTATRPRDSPRSCDAFRWFQERGCHDVVCPAPSTYDERVS
jgi:hypothetical protein